MVVELKRKREGKTDYRERKNLLKSENPRFVVRITNKQVITQIVENESESDKTIVSSYSKELEEYGWNFDCKNTPACYLTGFLCGYKALDKNIKKAIVDIGFQSGSKVYAVLKGAIDSGLEIPHNSKVFPEEKRIKGEHISNYVKKLKEENKFEELFSKYSKIKADPAKIQDNFLKVKSKIEEKWKK